MNGTIVVSTALLNIRSRRYHRLFECVLDSLNDNSYGHYCKISVTSRKRLNYIQLYITSTIAHLGLAGVLLAMAELICFFYKLSTHTYNIEGKIAEC